MIGCNRCLSNPADLGNYQVDLIAKNNDSSESDYESDEEYLKNCADCELRRESAVLDSLPEPIVQGFATIPQNQ